MTNVIGRMQAVRDRPHVLVMACKPGEVQRLRCYNERYVEMAVAHFTERGYAVDVLKEVG